MRKKRVSTNAPVCPVHRKPMRELPPEPEHKAKFGVQASLLIRAAREMQKRKAFKCPVIGCIYVQTVDVPEPTPKQPKYSDTIKEVKTEWHRDSRRNWKSLRPPEIVRQK